MEDYYHKVIKLQEMLRKSEEERLNLEIKFNETLQLIKQEEEVHLKRFRSKYKKFLDEDKQRQQRNYKILEALDRIENRTSMWETKTEKFRAMRKKYQSCIDLPSTTKYHKDFEDISKPSDYSVSEKNIVVDKYMDDYSPRNFNSDDEKTIDNSSFLNKYSNLGNINSLYSKFSHNEKADPEKVETFDSTPLKTSKDYANILKQNIDSHNYSFNKPWDESDILEKPPTFRNESDNLRSNYFPEITPLLKAPQTLIRLTQPEERKLVNKDFEESEKIKNWNKDDKPSFKYNAEEKAYDENPLVTKNYDVPFSNEEDLIETKGKITKDELLKENSGVQPVVNKREEEEHSKEPLQKYESEDEQGKNEALRELNMTTGLPVQRNENVTDIKRSSNIENQKVLNDEISEHGNYKETGQPIQPESLVQQYEEKLEPPIQQKDGNGQPIQKISENQQSIVQKLQKSDSLIRQYEENEKQTQQYEESGQPVQQFDENKQPYCEEKDEQPYHEQYDENGSVKQDVDNIQEIQQYDANEQQFDESGQPIQQYDANGQLIQQFHESEEPTQKCDANGQPYPQQYDENGQPIQQYDESGQPIQQYDESGQPIQQYGESGQPIQQYDENGQPIQQYDTTGQSYHPQYDESGQSIQQYDASGQLYQQQYDENGQPIQQYDATGQPYHQQYDENGQPIQQYDTTGQSYHQQYDESGQPIQQYDENGQPIQQYDANGQLYQQQYDENGQPIQEYDANGQSYHQQYDENGQPIQQYDENGQPYPQYDESGQPLQYYDESGQPAEQYKQQYDENGQPLQYNENEHLDNTNGQPLEPQDVVDEQEKDQPKSNVLDILETDTESLKVESKVSNDSDFDISNASKN